MKGARAWLLRKAATLLLEGHELRARCLAEAAVDEDDPILDEREFRIRCIGNLEAFGDEEGVDRAVAEVYGNAQPVIPPDQQRPALRPAEEVAREWLNAPVKDGTMVALVSLITRIRAESQARLAELEAERQRDEAQSDASMLRTLNQLWQQATGCDAPGEVCRTKHLRASPAPASAPLRERLAQVVQRAVTAWVEDTTAATTGQEMDARLGEAVQADTEVRIAASLREAGKRMVRSGDPEDQARGAAYLTAAREVEAGQHREPKEDR